MGPNQGQRRGGAHPAQLCAGAPPAEALVEVQHGDVGEVGHARDDLQEPEALDGALVVQEVQHDAQRVVCQVDDEGRLGVARCRLPQPLTIPHRLILQPQHFQLLAHLRTQPPGSFPLSLCEPRCAGKRCSVHFYSMPGTLTDITHCQLCSCTRFLNAHASPHRHELTTSTGSWQCELACAIRKSIEKVVFRRQSNADARPLTITQVSCPATCCTAPFHYIGCKNDQGNSHQSSQWQGCRPRQ